MVARRQQERVEKYIALGQEEGARVVVGGNGMPDGLDRGWYVRPTVFADVDNSMRIAQEEIFGPVLSVIPFDDVDDAVRIANDSEYGLAGTVWTGDQETGLDVARRVRTGTYGVNTYTMDFARSVRRLQELGHRPRVRSRGSRPVHRVQGDLPDRAGDVRAARPPARRPARPGGRTRRRAGRRRCRGPVHLRGSARRVPAARRGGRPRGRRPDDQRRHRDATQPGAPRPRRLGPAADDRRTVPSRTRLADQATHREPVRRHLVAPGRADAGDRPRDQGDPRRVAGREPARLPWRAHPPHADAADLRARTEPVRATTGAARRARTADDAHGSRGRRRPAGDAVPQPSALPGTHPAGGRGGPAPRRSRRDPDPPAGDPGDGPDRRGAGRGH